MSKAKKLTKNTVAGSCATINEQDITLTTPDGVTYAITPEFISLDAHIKLANELKMARISTNDIDAYRWAGVAALCSINSRLPMNIKCYQFIRHYLETLANLPTATALFAYIANINADLPDGSKYGVMNVMTRGIEQWLTAFDNYADNMIPLQGETLIDYHRRIVGMGICGMSNKIAAFMILLANPTTSTLPVVDRWILCAFGHRSLRSGTKNDAEYYEYEAKVAKLAHIVAPTCPVGIFHWSLWDSLRYLAGAPDAHKNGDSHLGLAV